MQCHSLGTILRYPSSSSPLAIGASLVVFVAVLTMANVPIAQAAAPTVVGTWDAADLSDGGHGGGTLRSDGSAGGGAHVVFNEATEVADFVGGSWQLSANSRSGARRVDLCLFVVAVRDPLGFFGHGPFCFRDVPAEGGRPTRILTASGFIVQIGIRLQ